MSALVQLTGGQFQDSRGNVLDDGYLIMRLSADEEVNDSLICSGISIRIQLNSSGSISTSPAQSVWGNDQMSPANSYYTVTGYTAEGQIAWGPNNQQVIGSGGTFDVGTWVPNSVVSWTPSPQPLMVEVAGTTFSSQTLLDFVNTGNVTFEDNGNGQLSATATAGFSVGQSIAPLSETFYPTLTGEDVFPGTIFCRVPGSVLTCFPSTWNITLNMAVAGTASQLSGCCVKRTLPLSATVIDSTPITFSGTQNPTNIPDGDLTSDNISLALDPNHDYWFMFFSPFVSGNDGQWGWQGNYGSTYLIEGGAWNTNDYTGATTIPNNGVSRLRYGLIPLMRWLAA